MKNRIIITLIAVMFIMQCTALSYAYFQRGNVNISAGKQSVTLSRGDSENVSVNISPSSDSQLPGCGMAECPQSCGEKECLDENGECTCNGKTYQTYYAYATASSSNTSVATASYNNGVVTIKGVGPGTATITLTASLRQYTSTSTSIHVTVNDTAASGSSNSGSGSTKASSAASGSVNTGSGNKVVSDKVTATAINKGKSVLLDGESGEEGIIVDEDGKVKVTDEAITAINSDRGKIYFVPIIVGTQGKEQFKKIMGKKQYVVFQAKDKAETVLYSWEFYGKDLKKAVDMNFEIKSSTDAFEGCEYGNSSDTVYLSFAHDGELPGKASIAYGVGDFFGEKDTLNLYLYDDAAGSVELVQDNVKCENSYAEISLEHCSKYILTSESFDTAVNEKKTTSNAGIIAVVILAAAVIVIVVKRRKKVAND